jgi:hypothetical protein
VKSPEKNHWARRSENRTLLVSPNVFYFPHVVNMRRDTDFVPVIGNGVTVITTVFTSTGIRATEADIVVGVGRGIVEIER